MSILTSAAALVAGAVLALSAVGVAPAPEPSGAGALIENYITENKIKPTQLALGYLNTVTGEEYYVNRDTNFYGASLYKVALNMYYAERVAGGEMEWTTKVRGTALEILMAGSLEQSNNNYSYKLYQALGAYRASKLKCAYLYGLTEEEARADRQFWTDSYITPWRMITCLNTLYTEPERFPTVIDHLLLAQPGRYFRLKEDRWEIAQKYGYLGQFGRDVSTAGIVYAPEPFELVVLTHNLPHAEEHIAAICVLLGDYISGQTLEEGHAAAAAAAREEAEAAAAEEAARAEAAAELSLEEAPAEETPAPEEAAQTDAPEETPDAA